MSDIEIEIDGKPFKAKPNSTIIQVADEAGIYIPRFCYHKHLSIAANCRMCLVEVEKSPKTLPACATPIMPGMKVFTRSAKALAAQKAVMEFLLINHPLDCPICDQGGECELQDLSMAYGSPESYFVEGKRSVKDQDIGPLIATDMTRCIQCTRCVRFGDEVAGLRELGATGRGEHMEIGTYVQHAMHSEVSGNIIDLCPVGALTSKPFRFTARAWELNQYPSVAPHDCVGTNINVHTRAGKVMRVVPRENVAINETWISDRDRYSYESLYDSARLLKPMIRIKNKLQETDWETALEFAAKGLQHIIKDHGAESLGALISPNATIEENFLLQKISRLLGSHHIDHRLRQTDFSDQAELPLFPGLTIPIAELDQGEQFLLIGSDLQREQPSLGLRVRKASLNGAKVFAVNMMDYRFHFQVAAKKITAPHLFLSTLAGIAKVLSPDHAALSDIQANEEHYAFAKKFQTDKKTIILLGASALNHPEAARIRALANLIAAESNGTIGMLTEGSNAAGAWIAGAIPHRLAGGQRLQQPGLNAVSMLQDPRKAYLLFNIEPELDCGNPVQATHALAAAEFVIACSIFKNPILEKTANVIFPIAPFTETAGTRVNLNGDWQSFRGIATSYGDSRPGWKVLRVLGNFLELAGFDYDSADAVLQEVKTLTSELTHDFSTANLPQATFQITNHHHELSRIGEIPIYSGDSLVRRAAALQATQAIIDGNLKAARIHPDTAAKLTLNENDMVYVTQQNNKVTLPIILDARVALDAVYLAGGQIVTAGLSELFGQIELNRLV